MKWYEKVGDFVKNISVKLFTILIVFADALITVMSLTTRYLLVNDIVEQQKNARADIENNIVADLETMDKAHRIFQEIETAEMEKGLQE